MGAEIVLMDGTILKIGGKHLDSEGYDLLGLITGSEGLLGVVTEVTVRILKNRFSGETGVACKLNYDPTTGRLAEHGLL